MAQTRRRYTAVDRSEDWLVTVAWDERALDTAHWFEGRVDVVGERTGRKVALPRDLATYRVGEVERPFRDYVRLDFDGDRDAALQHLLNTIYRRIYSFIERGH